MTAEEKRWGYGCLYLPLVVVVVVVVVVFPCVSYFYYV
jgi:hypothetical protein